MTPLKMHAGEVHTDASLVRRLLTAQFPQWADLPIARVASVGTNNALYRRGADMLVRLPRTLWDIEQAAKAGSQAKMPPICKSPIHAGWRSPWL